MAPAYLEKSMRSNRAGGYSRRTLLAGAMAFLAFSQVNLALAEDPPIADQIRQFIAFNLGKKVTAVTPDRVMMEDLCEGDEVVLARIFNKIERQFKVDPSIDDMSAWVTVGDIINYVAVHQSQ